MAYKTTKKDFAVFKAECKKWIKFFGLTEWGVYWHHGPLDSQAQCRFNDTEMTLLFTLASETHEKGDFALSGFHEACEALLAPMTAVVIDNSSEDKATSIVHNVVHRLENALYYKGK